MKSPFAVKIRIAAGLFFDCRATLHVLCLARTQWLAQEVHVDGWTNAGHLDLMYTHRPAHIYIQCIRHMYISDVYIYIYPFVYKVIFYVI